MQLTVEYREGQEGNPHSPYRGTIEVAPQAIATVAGRAAMDCDGIVGIAGKHQRFGAAELLPPERYTHGIEVHLAGNHITIDLHLILEYGRSIPTIAYTIMKQVQSAVESALALPVVQVNVIIQGLRVSDPTL
jgi:uncharacterized alkaline shock family protein YloU